MYTSIDDEVFLAPESIISGVLDAERVHDAAVDEFDLGDDFAVEAAELDRYALEL